MRWFLRSKIHNATVTEAELEYVGSIGIDEALMAQAGLMDGEKVLIVDVTNGARLETYVIREAAGSGAISIRGAAAHLVHPGDRVIIMGFELADEPPKPQKVLVDAQNRFERYM